MDLLDNYHVLVYHYKNVAKINEDKQWRDDLSKNIALLI